MTVFTIGHSKRPLEVFVALLHEAGIDTLVDVRAAPGSRAHPQFNAEPLAARLAADGIVYRHLASLGGRRPAFPGPSRNDHWREAAFRNYADYAMTAAFRDGLAEVVALASTGSPAVMCAELAWQRCHRQIVADYLLAAGLEVRHIVDTGRSEPGRMNPAAERQPDGSLVYRARPEHGLPLFERSAREV